jgi:hypothetical protein
MQASLTVAMQPYGLRAQNAERLGYASVLAVADVGQAAVGDVTARQTCFPFLPTETGGTDPWMLAFSSGSAGATGRTITPPTQDMTGLEVLRYIEDRTGDKAIFNVVSNPATGEMARGAITFVPNSTIMSDDWWGPSWMRLDGPIDLVEGRDFDAVTIIDDATQAIHDAYQYVLGGQMIEAQLWGPTSGTDPAWGGFRVAAATTNTGTDGVAPDVRYAERQVKLEGLRGRSLMRPGVTEAQVAGVGLQPDRTPIPLEPVYIYTATGLAIRSAVASVKVEYVSGTVEAEVGTGTAGLWSVLGRQRSVF